MVAINAPCHRAQPAVVQHNLQTELLSTSPQEYLAHATQLGVMPVERREAIIKKMAIEPGRFTFKSYKHLIGMSDPAPYVTILLNAKWFYVYVP